LTQNEIKYRGYCKELKQLAQEQKDKDGAKKEKERLKMYNLGGEDSEANKP